jgi:uncharacterized RDD family membrane protein YckC
MATRQRDRSLGDGVYFAPQDYVGFWPRLVILLIDALVVWALVWLLAFVWWKTVGDYTWTFLGLNVLLVWLYLVPLKRSAFRTVAYRLMGVKLVALSGRRPPLALLTIRLLLWMFGPFNLLFDLIWCTIDDDRQTMRDRFTCMCLVKNHATPIGTGEVHLAYINALSYSLAFPRVVHPKLEQR